MKPKHIIRSVHGRTPVGTNEEIVHDRTLTEEGEESVALRMVFEDDVKPKFDILLGETGHERCAVLADIPNQREPRHTGALARDIRPHGMRSRRLTQPRRRRGGPIDAHGQKSWRSRERWPHLLVTVVKVTEIKVCIHLC